MEWIVEGVALVFVASLVAAVTVLVVTLIPDPPPDIVASYCCRHDSAFGARIAAGLDAGVEDTGLSLLETEVQPPNIELLSEYASRGTGLILSDGTLDPLSAHMLVEKHPDLIVGYMECSGMTLTHQRIWCVNTANHEMGFLAGAVAGLTTETQRVGIVLGANAPNMPAFLAGFEQGVSASNQDAIIDAVYLTNVFPYQDLSGFGSPGLGYLAATEMYERGSDVVFAAAGESNKGIHEAAFDYSAMTGSHVWSIGADDDEWLFYDGEWWPVWASEDDIAYLSDRSLHIQEHILTSIEKRSSVAIALLLQAYATGESADHLEQSIANEAITYTTTGGHLVPFESHIERLVEDVVAGRITIAAEPTSQAPTLPDWFSLKP